MKKKMKRAYTLIEVMIVLAIIFILMLPIVNISKSYKETLIRVKAKGSINDLSNLISYSKYYCRYYESSGSIEIDKDKGVAVFKDISLKGVIVKTLILEDGVRFAVSKYLSINKVGKVQSDSIRIIDSEGNFYKITISTGVDTVNVYEGE